MPDASRSPSPPSPIPRPAAPAISFPELIEALHHPDAYPHPVGRVERIDTHISTVLLAGNFAYKLKKPVDFGFIDFTTLERRRHFCQEEIRINRRLAPRLYLDVVSVRATPVGIQLGETGETLEYAVRMRRFPRHAVLTETPIDRPTIDQLAEQIARFHQQLPAASVESGYGSPERVLDPMLANVRVLRDTPIGDPHQTRINNIERWTLARYQALRPVLLARQQQGWIRECHGDLHRGNIALFDDQPLIFDAIEFNPELRWIDCMSDVAFLAMDLRQADQIALERRFVNAYLEHTGDYAGLALLPFYQVYRAMVRAKVSGLRLQFEGDNRAERAKSIAELGHYLQVAENFTRKGQPRLFITHGLSGSGKTWLGHALRERLPLIQIRSDVERKRLLAHPETDRGEPVSQAELYTQDMTERTYRHLRHLADRILTAGYSVLIDATCLRRHQRNLFRDLADRRRCPFTILSLTATLELLTTRIQERIRRGDDASDADLAVVERQQHTQEPLSAQECAHAILLDTESPATIARFLDQPALDQNGATNDQGIVPDKSD